MMKLRKAAERGIKEKNNEKSFFSFSFDEFYDPNHLGFRHLKVLNEDFLAPSARAGAHGHREMEIVTYVLKGVLEQRDHYGVVRTLPTSEIQVLSTGQGVRHEEYNLSSTEPVHYVQLWFTPLTHQLEPTVAQRHFPEGAKWGQWGLMVSQNGRNGSLKIQQDVDLYITLMDGGDEIIFPALEDRYYWIQVLSGRFLIQGAEFQAKYELFPGDGLAIDQESSIHIKALSSGELLLIDMS